MKKLWIQKGSALALGLMLSLGTVACGGAGSTTTTADTASSPANNTEQKQENSGTNSTETKELRKLSFVLDWTPNTNHTGLYAAQELGFYAEEGIELDIQQPPEGGAEALVAAGKADFAVSFQDSIAPAYTQTNPLPVTSIAAIINHNTSGIISLKSSGIDSPKGLEGKRYATWSLPVEQAVMKNVMEADGADYSKLELIPSTVTDVMTALQTDIDAVWIFYAWDGVAAQVAGLETNYWNFADINPVFDYYSPTIIAADKMLAEDPEIVKAFLRATAKGYQYAIDQPDAAADILLKAAPELDPALVKASQKWLAEHYIADGERWGAIDPERWNAFYAWLWDNQLIEQEIPKDTGYSNDFLP